MKIIGKRDEFLDWLEKLSVGGTFETATVKITPTGIVSSNMGDVIYRYLKYTKLKTVVDEEGEIINFQVDKLYQTIDKLFSDDDKITVETTKENGDEVLVISSKNITRKQPLFSIDENAKDVDRLRFKVENNTPFLRGGEIEMKNKVILSKLFIKKMIDVSSLQDIISRWRLSIKNSKFIVEVGDVVNGKDIVKLQPEKVIVRADYDVTVDFGLQLKNISKIFKTDVTVFLENNLPGIFHEYTMNYDLWIMVSHIVPEDLIEEEIKAEQEIAMAEGEAEAMMQAEEEAKAEEIAQQELEFEMSQGAPEE